MTIRTPPDLQRAAQRVDDADTALLAYCEGKATATDLRDALASCFHGADVALAAAADKTRTLKERSQAARMAHLALGTAWRIEAAGPAPASPSRPCEDRSHEDGHGGDLPFTCGFCSQRTVYRPCQWCGACSVKSCPSFGVKRTTAPATVTGPLFDRLREWRIGVARVKQMPPYVIATDAVLRAIAQANPTTRDELAAVRGMSPSKVQVYGDEILAAIKEA